MNQLNPFNNYNKLTEKELYEYSQTIIPLTERQMSDVLDAEMDRLGLKWKREVSMIVATPGNPYQPASKVRIDRVVQIGNFLLGIEIKSSPDKLADIGKYGAQASSYANGQIQSGEWEGKSLFAVFLCFELFPRHSHFITHFQSAQRLFGPFKVGFVNSHYLIYGGWLEFRLCADRFWCPSYGFNVSLVNHNHRVGSQTINLFADSLPVITCN